MSPTFGQSGEHPTYVTRIVKYMDATNYWFGSNHTINGTVVSPPAVPLEYTVWEPTNPPWSGHIVVKMESGGFVSKTGAEVLTDRNTNIALGLLRRGFKFIILNHGSVNISGNDKTGAEGQPGFIASEIFDQVHIGMRHIRHFELLQNSPFPNPGPIPRIGAVGNSSGGGLAMTMATMGHYGSGLFSWQQQTSQVDCIAVGAPGSDVTKLRDSPNDDEDTAFFYQLPEYWAHPVLTSVEIPLYPGEFYPHPYPTIVDPLVPDDPDEERLSCIASQLYASGDLGWSSVPTPPLDLNAPFPWRDDIYPHKNWDPNLLTLHPNWYDPPHRYPDLNCPPGMSLLPVIRAMSALTALDESAPPMFIVHGNEDYQVDYHQTELILEKAATLPGFESRLHVRTEDGGGHGSVDVYGRYGAATLAFFDLYIRGLDDSDLDFSTRDLEALRGTDPADPDTDGDGMVDGAEYGATALSDPLDPADGLRVTDVTVNGMNIDVTFQGTVGETYVLQQADVLAQLAKSAKHEWLDVAGASVTLATTTSTLSAPTGTITADYRRFYRVRRETIGAFDMISCEPVGLVSTPIRRRPTQPFIPDDLNPLTPDWSQLAGPMMNYLSAPLVEREARNKLESVTTSPSTADLELEYAIDLDNNTSLTAAELASGEWVAIFIRDGRAGYRCATFLDGDPQNNVLPLGEDAGVEGHWWPVTGASESNPGSGILDTVTVALRSSGTEPDADHVGSTIAIRKRSTLEDLLGPVGAAAPFRDGDRIELYDGQGAPVPGDDITFDASLGTHGEWVETGTSNVVLLSSYLLWPDEAIGYEAAPTTSIPEVDQVVKAGWVPMGDIVAYIDVPVGVSAPIKNWPYPVDCPHQVEENRRGDGDGFHGWARSGLGTEAFLVFPWPDGQGPGIGSAAPFDYAAPITEDGNPAFAVVGVPNSTANDLLRYWVAPAPQSWVFHPPGYGSGGTHQDFGGIKSRLRDEYASIQFPEDAGPLFDGPLFQTGRGRKVIRVWVSGAQLIEWRRMRPYFWRF